MGRGFVEEPGHMGRIKTGTKGECLCDKSSDQGEDTRSALLLQLLGF